MLVIVQTNIASGDSDEFLSLGAPASPPKTGKGGGGNLPRRNKRQAEQRGGHNLFHGKFLSIDSRCYEIRLPFL